MQFVKGIGPTIAKMLGAARTLPKPLQMDDLLSAINELEAEVLA